MKLSKLKLTNFKGVKAFELYIAGKNATIFGDNATGKTTSGDAMYWLLFDKDSQQRKQFEIKTLGKTGEALHGLNHEVEGVFILDEGREVTLKKIYSETWTKRRGEAKKQFTGHSTDYFIDDVPVKKKEFSERTAELFNEDQFKLLTSPTYFPEVLPWQTRRSLLIEVCGGINDLDVVNANREQLKGFLSIIHGYTVDDYRRIINAKRGDLNKELEKIPVRIDEVERGLPDTSDIDAETAEKEVIGLTNKIIAAEDEITRIKTGGQTAELKKQLAEVEGELQRVKNEAFLAQQKDVQAQYKKFALASNDHTDADQFRISTERKWQVLADEISEIESKLNRLRQDWCKKNDNKFTAPESPDVCPACGQSIPENMRQEATEKALAEFNLKKSRSIEAIDKEGMQLKKNLDDLKARHREVEKDALACAEATEKARFIMAEEEKKYDTIKKAPVKIDDAGLQHKKEALLNEIKVAEDTPAGLIKEAEAKKFSLQEKMAEIKNGLALVSSRKLGEKRIEDLKAQERELSGQLEQIEQELFMIETFVKTKVELLESKINSRFKMARFKLFKEQINGGLDECCDVTFNGVPYSDLNNGSRINVGLDIIKTLQDHFKIKAPVIIDNAESITDIMDIGCQMIKLIVSGKDKKLRVEIGE